MCAISVGTLNLSDDKASLRLHLAPPEYCYCNFKFLCRTMLEDKESHVSPSPTHSSTALPCLLPYVDFSPDLLRSFRHFFSDINFVFFKCKIGAQLSPSYWHQAVIPCSEMSASCTLGRNTSYCSTGPELLEEWVPRFSEAGARQELPLRWLLVLLSPSHPATDAVCASDVSVVVEGKHQVSNAFAVCHVFRWHVHVKFQFAV